MNILKVFTLQIRFYFYQFMGENQNSNYNGRNNFNKYYPCMYESCRIFKQKPQQVSFAENHLKNYYILTTCRLNKESKKLNLYYDKQYRIWSKEFWVILLPNTTLNPVN